MADAAGERHGLVEQRAERLGRLDTLRAAGVDVQPYRFERSATAGELHSTHADLAPDFRTGLREQVAGRIAGLRRHAKLTFATIHSPEFTAVEAYMALADCRDVMDLTERLIVYAAEEAAGRLTLTIAGSDGDRTIDLTPPWPRRRLLDLVSDVAGQRLHPSMPVADVRKVLDTHRVPWEDRWGSGKLIFELYDKVLEAATVEPTFVWGYPVAVSPLARRSAEDPELADRFELVIGGRELANGYSELNDAVDQRQRFDHEAALVAGGDVEAHPADADFLYALEVGLPPTGGIGIGVDRLVMLIAEVAAIRDVILFPLLRPEDGS